MGLGQIVTEHMYVHVNTHIYQYIHKNTHTHTQSLVYLHKKQSLLLPLFSHETKQRTHKDHEIYDLEFSLGMVAMASRVKCKDYGRLLECYCNR